MKRRILAFSSSREGLNGYLATAVEPINRFLGNKSLEIAFIPFASVNRDYDIYTNKVNAALQSLPYTIQTVNDENAVDVIEKADVIMVGGGNTFKLLHDLYALQLLPLIKEKVNNGTPFIGWSAGSNIAGATICTSNDMPIINPGSFTALGFFPFQVNPHYYNQVLPGFNGETRNDRLAEFLQLNPSVPIIALPEGTALLQEEERLLLTGNTEAILFTQKKNEIVQQVIGIGDDISWLLKNDE